MTIGKGWSGLIQAVSVLFLIAFSSISHAQLSVPVTFDEYPLATATSTTIIDSEYQTNGDDNTASPLLPGLGFSVTASTGPLTVYNSTPGTNGNDLDLEFSNTGNVLIAQEVQPVNTNPDGSFIPDDVPNAVVTVDFETPLNTFSFSLVDVEPGTDFIFTDSIGGSATLNATVFNDPASPFFQGVDCELGNNNFCIGTVPVTAEAISLVDINQFVIEYQLSGGIDSFVLGFETGSWSGNVLEDTNNDGLGDQPIENVLITLFRDINGDGVLTQDEIDAQPDAETTETDVSGNYLFEDVVIGDYIAVETQPIGFNNVSENEGGDDNDILTNPANNNQIAGTIASEEGVDAGNNFVEVRDFLPAIDLEKSVFLGHDSGASCPSSVQSVTGANGTEITYCFTVTNTGNTFLNDIVLNDVTLGIARADLSLLSGVEPLAPGASLIFIFEDTLESDLVNTATVSGNPVTAVGVDIVGVGDPTDSDTAEIVQNIAPAIEIIKTAGGAADGDTLTLTAAGDVVYTYLVTNTGNTFLSDLVVTDDAGTPTDTSDDVTVTSCTPALAGPFAPLASTTCTATLNVAVDTTNIASTSGNPTDSVGNDLPGVASPTDNDDAVVTVVLALGNISGNVDGAGTLAPLSGVTLTLIDDVNGNGVADAGEPTVGAPVQTDTNGDYVFDNVAFGDYVVVETQPTGFDSISEDEGGADDATDNGVLNAIAVTVDAADPDGGLANEDEGNDFVEGRPEIELIKSISNVDISNGDPTVADADDVVTYSFSVTNTGAVPLTNISVSDTSLVGLVLSDTAAGNCAAGPVAPSASVTCAVTGTYILLQSDVDAGFVENSADVAADSTNNDGSAGIGATDDSDTGTTPSAPGEVVEVLDPSGTENETDLANNPADPTEDPTVLTLVPLVSIGNLVWFDNGLGGGVANDGILNGGEAGIPTVQVELYNASDTPGIDAPVSTTTTATDGSYLFTVSEGDYFVHIPASQFIPGQPLSGAVSSNGQGVADNALDDDLNEDGDDDESDGVSSPVYSLQSNSEPTGETGFTGITVSPNDDGNTNSTVDFGFFTPFSLGSFVWQDNNSDGLQGLDEPPIAGAVLSLLVEDPATPGTFIAAIDIDGAAVADLTTGLNGQYLFTDLPVGNYVVQVTPPSGLFPTLVQTDVDNDNQVNDSNIANEVTPGSRDYQSGVFALNIDTASIEAGPDANRGDAQDGIAGSRLDLNGNMTVDFGFIVSASIGNFVWLDNDADGVQDANEDGIAGVTVNLLSDTNNDGVISGSELSSPISTVITGPNGEYLFPDLEPGVVYITSVDATTVPNGLIQTFDEGPLGAVGVLDNASDPIVLAAGEEHLTADFGYAPPVGSIGDLIWIDTDDDGVRDPGEQGIADVTVTLTPAPDVDLGEGPGNPITTSTDANGQYLFVDLPLGETYIVDVDISTLPSGVVASSSGLGDPDVRDGNSTTADNQTTVVLTTDQPVNLDADFGYLPAPTENNSVGDTIWLDADSDGQGPIGAVDGTDLTELPLAGVTVSLIDNLTGNVVASEITDVNGQYLFTGVPDGLYTVQVTDQNNILASLNPTFDVDGIGTPGQSVVDLDSLGVSDTPIDDRDQDFGYVSDDAGGGIGSIGDMIFLDQDNSGSFDPGEGIEGVTVQLFGPGPDGDISTSADNELLATATTDENGNYLFTGLEVNADYSIVVDTATLPNGGAGFSNSVDPDTVGDGNSTSIVTLTTTDPINLDQDFGYIGAANNSLSGTVWPDTNGDGVLVEPGIFAGVTIEIQDLDGNVIRKVATDLDGNYSVENLPDGQYVVVVTDEDNVLGGFTHTDSPNGLSDTTDSTSKDDTGYVVDLDSAGINPNPVSDSTGDFGYLPVITNPISLGLFKSTASGGGEVIFDWATQTELANIAFNVYGELDGAWVVINDSPIIAQGDSVQVQTYSITIKTDATVFALSDIDLTGKETLHGPYVLGQSYGEIGERKETDWDSEKSTREANEAQREELRMKQQIERSLERNSNAIEPLGLAPDSLPKEKPSMANRIAAGIFITFINLFVSDVYAADSEPLVNLKTTQAGIHEVNVSDLSSFGVAVVGQRSDRLALINNGASVAIEVTGGEIISEQSTIRFIAEQIDTLYTDQNVYTLTLDESLAQRISSIDSPIPARAPVATSYLRSAIFAPQTRYSFTSPDREDAFYAKRMVTIGQPMSENIVLSLDDVAEGGNTGGTRATLNVNVWGGANQPGVAPDHSLEVAFNGRQVAQRRFDGLVEQEIETGLEGVREGSNVVRLTMPLDTGYAFDAINLNSIQVDYPSKFIAKDNRLDFVSTFSNFRVRGFSPTSLPNGEDDLIVMRSDASGTVSINTKVVRCRISTCLVQIGGSGSVAHYYLSSKNALHTPELSPLPISEDITSGNARYLIISHPDFIGASGGNHLETLETELRSEMGSVDIVDVESIYAQFGGHIFDPLAIQRYIKFAHENRDTQYVLLVGGDVYDYRRYENEDAMSFIPSLYAATGSNVTFAPVDAKYVDLDDDNVPDLPIGRLPVRSAEELGVLMKKRQDYLDRDYAGKALLVADDFDEVQQYDFVSDAEEIASNYLQSFDLDRAYIDELGTSQARTTIRESIEQGASLTAFFGHSSTNQWSFNGLFTGPDAARLENAGKPTVVMQWGCWNAYYVSPNEDSMAHRFLMEGDRGAVAVMGATTLTNANSERMLARLVFERLSNGERLGDAVTNAKQAYAQDYPNDLDVLLGWTVLGMPDLFVD